ncbi:MAG: hypothetical protein CBD26_03915 [Candidatus Pelagibacter sp. TMED166]|nr:MAG: hypothetical protein CBD26_03915 [Candidatus Pelagibacter sp. TMED166]|tara:strand:- start:15912 stop:16742 length:831 start_codon:yes stop_codon:yes gene_type:complete
MKKIVNNWRDYIINEATRADKEGIELPDMIEILSRYVSDDTFNPEYFITFHEINKVGVNPQTPYTTPVGIYTYPLLSGLVRQIKDGTVPFASDARYVSILKPTDPSKILSMTNDPGLRQFVKLFSQETVDKFNLSGGALEKDVKAIDRAVEEMKQSGKDMPSFPRWSAIFSGVSEIYNKKAKRKNMFAKLWMCTWIASEKNPAVWNGILRYLGYDAAYDSNGGVIHRNEKQQAVFLSKSALEVIQTLPNKMGRDIVQKKMRKQKYGIDYKQIHRDY